MENSSSRPAVLAKEKEGLMLNTGRVKAEKRKLRISWTYHVINVMLFQRLVKAKKVISIVEKRNEVLQVILQSKAEGKRGPGRRQTS